MNSPARPAQRLLRIAALGALFALAAAYPAEAGQGAGVLDSPFSENGISLTRPGGFATGEVATGLFADRRGRLTVAGTTDNEEILVRRFHSDGSPDPSFGENGRVETSLGPAAGWAIKPVPGNGFLVVGGTETGLALVRYRGDGSRIRSFGRRGHGHVVTPGGTEGASAYAVDIQRNGRIVVGGFKLDLSRDWTGLVTGYRPNGSIDRGFARHGTFEIYPPKGYVGTIVGVEVLRSGKILVGGDLAGYLMLARLLPNGRPDPRFGGGDGVVLVGGNWRCACGFANSLTIGPGGKPLLAGAVLAGRDTSLLARFTPDGRLDRGFGKGGIVRTRRGSRLVLNDATLQRGGKITAAGYYVPRGTGGAQIAVLRYLPNGQLDRGFAHGGFFHRRLGRGSIGWAAITQPDGRVVVAGGASFGEPDPEFSVPVEGSRMLMLRFTR